ncbi:putative zinc finger protein family member [Trypanosoma conorhini]|uniref:Putative zinc finger protein family member n=1 Tax=Trypanosoma conorhini TaxID=83891 RepID=A0A3R7L483_9TRYP|nr:putative zinc finger protein family member [Trypanosoma conorhini]RNF07254.1 putative zinc finger protein family member [Trypanosoma conorhini]
MFGPDFFHQAFPPGVGGNPTGAASPLVTVYGIYPKSNMAASIYANMSSLAASTAALYQRPYCLSLNGFGAPPSVPREEEEETEGQFEVTDSHWKPHVPVHGALVSPSAGCQIFLGAQPPASGADNCKRVCVRPAFHEVHGIIAENGKDARHHPEYLMKNPHEMLSWLQEKEREFQQTLLRDPRKAFRVFCADLKEVVEVPISALRFTKGLYVDPSLRVRRVRSGHQNQFSMMASQVPTACGLFSEDPSQCKWERWCNQVHIEQGWMQSKKREFGAWSNALERRFNGLPPDHLFSVHDPQLKSTLNLPKASISGFSRGLFQGSAKKAPSVCMLFQRGRCTAGSCCNQIHVDPEYLQLHRRWAYSGEQLTEEKRREIWEQMASLLRSLSSRCENGVVGENDSSDPARELNPKAQPFVPSPTTPLPPPAATERTPAESSMVIKDKVISDARSVMRDDNVNNSSVLCQTRHVLMADPVSMEQEIFFPPVVLPDTSVVARPHQQQQENVCKHISSNGTSSSNSRSRTSNSAGGNLPLWEFAPVADGDERSQSSLQASHSNISHASRSHRHTNNPYTLGGSSSCTASPTFGWVQPVRSAGNSCTTIPTGCVGADASGSLGALGWGTRTRTDPSPGASDTRSAPFSVYHDLDGSLHSYSPNQHWNASGSVCAKTVEELQKVKLDNFHANAEDNVFFGTP